MSAANLDNTSKAPRILSLDGGGVLSLSSLFLLKHLMREIGSKHGIEPPEALRPSECFDLIVGIGTGGLCAVFLGRMRMTVDEAIQEYLHVITMAFRAPTFLELGFSLLRAVNLQRLVPFGLLKPAEGAVPAIGKKIEQRIQDVTERFLKDRAAMFEDKPQPSGTTCRTAVFATERSVLNEKPFIFRSYPTSELFASQERASDVASATVAEEGHFPFVTLGTLRLSYTSLGPRGLNNPAGLATEESEKIWPKSRIACLVSLGTGRKITSESSRGYERVHTYLDKGDPTNFRFEVSQGLDGQNWDWFVPGANHKLETLTDEYTRKPGVIDDFKKCVLIWDHTSFNPQDDTEPPLT